MNQLLGLFLGLVLISGTVVPSFAQTNSNDQYLSFFELLKYLFSSGDVKIITTSGSISDFDKAVIVLSSSTATDSPDETEDEHDQTSDETDNETNDNSQTNDKTKEHDVDEFHHGTIQTSSNTSAEKVTLCHVAGNSGKSHSITVAASSVSAHLAHGDYLGTCDDSIKSLNHQNESTHNNKESKDNHNNKESKDNHNNKESKDNHNNKGSKSKNKD